MVVMVVMVVVMVVVVVVVLVRVRCSPGMFERVVCVFQILLKKNNIYI